MSSFSSAIDSLSDSMSSLSSQMTSYASSMDPTDPEDTLMLQQYEYEYESTLNTESALIYDLKEMVTTVTSNMK